MFWHCDTHQIAVGRTPLSTNPPGASGDAYSHKALYMSAINDGSTNPLPEELERALRRATDRTLAALTALRRAVRDHVHNERDGGASLQQIELDLRALIERAHKNTVRGDGADGEHETLTTEMIRWSEGFFSQND